MRDNHSSIKGNPIQTEEVTFSWDWWREVCSRQREQIMQRPCDWKELEFFEKPREGQCS